MNTGTDDRPRDPQLATKPREVIVADHRQKILNGSLTVNYIVDQLEATEPHLDTIDKAICACENLINHLGKFDGNNVNVKIKVDIALCSLFQFTSKYQAVSSPSKNMNSISTGWEPFSSGSSKDMVIPKKCLSIAFKCFTI